jgi:hypothetical protein
MMCRTLSLFSALSFLIVSSAGAQTEPSANVLHFGRASGWKDFPTTTGTGLQKSKDGSLDLVLAASEYTADDDTDLLVHFNDRLKDDAVRYRIAPDPARIQRGFAALGGGSAIFRGDTPLVLQSTSEALFSAGKGWGDFSLEFWLYPAQAEDGETVVEWQAGRTSSGTFETQDLRASFESSHMVWTFQNLFAASPALPAVTLTVKGSSILIPKQWHHHLLRYQASTGLIEYLVDGKTEGLTYATPSHTEDGHPFAAVTGPRTRGELVIGGRYQGALDELRLTRAWVDQPQRDRFLADFAAKGTAISRIFDLRFPGSTVETVTAKAATPGDTALVWSFRMSDSIRYQWTFGGDTAKSLAPPDEEEDSWVRFTPGQDLGRVAAGRYLQLKVDLLPSGTGTDTPRVNEVTVTTRPSPPPPTPSGIELVPGDGQITVRWRPVLQGNPDGYYLFLSPRPHQATQPIDAGKVTEYVLSGLSNDQIYYVSVAAHRSSAVGPLSKELAARPQRKAP